MTRPCGCDDAFPFPTRCAQARALEALLNQAIKERDREAMRRLGAILAGSHEDLPAELAPKVARLSGKEETP